MYVTGDNSNNQLGMELPLSAKETLSSRRASFSLVALDFNLGKPLQVRKLAFGVFSSMLTFSGELYVWGSTSYQTPTLLKAQSQSEKSSLEPTLSRVTIPTVLFREVKVLGSSLVAADVDNSMWKW